MVEPDRHGTCQQTQAQDCGSCQNGGTLYCNPVCSSGSQCWCTGNPHPECSGGDLSGCGVNVSCPGGLPEGVSGVITIPSADPHAELAGLLLLKRGCSIVFTGKHAFPIFDSYTTESAETPIACARGTLSIVRTLYNLPELYPLIGMTEEDVKLNLNHFKSLVKP